MLRFVLLSLFLPVNVWAETAASLSNDFQLNIPEVRYHPSTGSDQVLSVQLQAISTKDLTFKVTDFKPVTDTSTVSSMPLIQPLSLIISEPTEIINITSDSATLTFVSSVPLACAVVYGTSTAYGQVAVDNDMQGGAHTNHHPLLIGLKPETTYFYRQQGTAPDGSVYIGDNGTFTSGKLETTTTNNPVNLALQSRGAIVSAVSSNFGGSENQSTWGANSAIDNNNRSAWSSSGDGNDAFIEITLANSANIHTIEVWSRDMSDGTAIIKQFTITTDDGTVSPVFTLENSQRAYFFNFTATSRVIRLSVVDSTGGNTGLVHFGIYGDFVN